MSVDGRPVDGRPAIDLRWDERQTERVTTLRRLTGWGRTAPTVSEVRAIGEPQTVASMVKRSGPRGTLARGLGRSYGDAATNAGGVVLDGRTSRGILELDLVEGLVTVRAGTSIDELMKLLVPLGWFVPVTPGTRQVTVGGAIAADIHGKNHHHSGSWCSHVESMRIIVGDGSILDVSPNSPGSDAELFWATAGGMGLTGLVVDATIAMSPISTSRVAVDTDRTRDIDELMSIMVDDDDHYDFSVAWIDLTTHRGRSGRSVLTRGNFATVDQLSPRLQRNPLAFSTAPTVDFPTLPAGLLRPSTIAAFNGAWYHKSPRRRRQEIQTIGEFFHPLDIVGKWNRAYGRRGFVQWQYAVPDRGARVIRRTIEVLESSGYVAFLALLKRFGPGDAGHLSFPIEGWTLALDLPVQPGLGTVLDGLDELVAAAGGRLYLAKDSRMRPEMMAAMYPRLDEWKAVRERVDPDRHFQSDLGRRLGLV